MEPEIKQILFVDHEGFNIGFKDFKTLHKNKGFL